jgi:glycogen operon protein
MVSYDGKHNEANGEDNKDGTDDNCSSNYGAEGDTDDPQINEVRCRQIRNMLATLLLSQGVPMICGGDEIGRTQGGNNNAYAQDNETSWFNWELDDRRTTLLEFTRRLIQIRRAHPNLHRRKFFQDRGISPGVGGRDLGGGRQEKDITWLRPDGLEMTEEEWNTGWVRCIGMRLNGRTLDDVNPVGQPIIDDTFLTLINPHTETIQFYMPEDGPGASWEEYLETTCPKREGRRVFRSGEPFELAPRSLALLREREPKR